MLRRSTVEGLILSSSGMVRLDGHREKARILGVNCWSRGAEEGTQGMYGR